MAIGGGRYDELSRESCRVHRTRDEYRDISLLPLEGGGMEDSLLGWYNLDCLGIDKHEGVVYGPPGLRRKQVGKQGACT